ncbi:MAG: hypothetical protein IPK26_10160 [Planctomycetes bacterium]|nr:hypothetical protein [Planctomycetota bacterium]
MRRRFLVCSAVLSALNAQQPGAGHPLASDGVVFDVAADGVPWARGRDWKAHWRDGWCVFRPAGNREDLSIRLAEVTVGSETVVVGAPKVARTGRRVQLSHPGLVEAWATSPASLEQSFAFADLPGRGELCLRLEVLGAFEPRSTEAGIRFATSAGVVRYETCVAIDAKGRRVNVPIEWSAGGVCLRVPAAFVVEAELPLVVDPTLAVAAGFSTPQPGPARVVHDEFTSQYLVVWESRFSPSDMDVIAQRLGSDGTPIGGPIAIDITTSNVERPRLAANAFAGTWLCVAQGGGGALPIVALARRVSVEGIAVPPAPIAGAGFGGLTGDALHVDVGGSPQLDGSARYTIVFERRDAVGATEVWAWQADGGGALLAGGPQRLAHGLRGPARPVISRSCGFDPWQSSAWTVAWQTASAGGDRDVQACALAWDGAVVAGPVDVDADADDDGDPLVSSPVLVGAERVALLAWQQAGGGPRLAVFDRAGQVRLRSGFAIPGTTAVIGDLDSDGSRFAIVATATPLAGGSAQTMATAVAWRSDFASLRVDLQERPFAGGDPESDPAVYALRSSAGASSGAVYGIVVRRHQAGGPQLELAIWDGRQPGPQLVVREPHCGGIPANAFTIVGSCVIGGELWFDMPTDAFSGFMVGTPADLQIPVCNCRVGVVDANMVANPYVTILPSEPTLVGAMFSTQGYIIGSRSSTCLGVIDLSYTIDITIR